MDIQLMEILDELSLCCQTIQGCEVVTKEGLTLASHLPEVIDEEWMAAISAAFAHLSLHAASHILQEPVLGTLIRSQHGWLIILPCENKAVLSAIVSFEQNLNNAFVLLENTANKIAAYL